MGSRKLKILIVIPNLGSGEIGVGYLYWRAFQQLGHSANLYPIEDKPVSRSIPRRMLNRLKRLEPFRPYWQALHEKRLLENAKRVEPDIMIVTRCEHLTREAVSGLKKYSRHAVWNIYTDSPAFTPGFRDNAFRESMGEYDTIFSFARYLHPVFYQLGARNVEWLPFAYDPEIHRPLPLDKQEESIYKSQVSYLGAYGPLQIEWLTPLISEGLKLWGNNWHHLPRAHPLRRCWQQGRGHGPEMWKAVVGAKVVFNMTRAEHGCGHSMKTFEIPACGGMVITNRTEDQTLFFRDRQEAVFFDSHKEALDLIRFYLNHDREREKILSGGIKAVMPHTYVSRVQSLLSYFETGKMPKFC